MENRSPGVRRFAAGVAVLAAAISGVGAAAAAPAVSWPETSAGAVARQWVEAFSAGEEAMMKFLVRNMTPESLKKRSLKERIESYRSLQKKYGTLKLESVVDSGPGELHVMLQDASGAKRDFTFTVGTEAPFKLVSIAVRESHSPFH
ncbi:MAG: hypothetical protein ACRD16_08860 [Thermoanaerobaculia bacterium]